MVISNISAGKKIPCVSQTSATTEQWAGQKAAPVEKKYSYS